MHSYKEKKQRAKDKRVEKSYALQKTKAKRRRLSASAGIHKKGQER